MQWHDVTWKILGGPLGGQAKFLGGNGPPCHPPSSAPGHRVVKVNNYLNITVNIILPSVDTTS